MTLYEAKQGRRLPTDSDATHSSVVWALEQLGIRIEASQATTLYIHPEALKWTKGLDIGNVEIRTHNGDDIDEWYLVAGSQSIYSAGA